MKRILFIVTSHGDMGNTGRKTGWFLPEVAHPYNILIKAGFDITVASPKGGVTPMDPQSGIDFAKDEECIAFLKDEAAQKKMTQSIKLSDVNYNDFDAVVFPGGHGPMFDLATDELSQSITAKVYEKGGVVSAVCHGPAGLVNVKLSTGEPLLKDKRVTGFSNSEEDAVQLTSVMPFLLETELKQTSQALYEKADKDWGVRVVVDGRVVTGQNPASASEFGKALAKLLA
ncbi:putative chaperone protein HSP31 [Zopfochytrium polystomum]|nr:putative chaperone protein HSP31 [Zopfochytrium polystomum]